MPRSSNSDPPRDTPSPPTTSGTSGPADVHQVATDHAAGALCPSAATGEEDDRSSSDSLLSDDARRSSPGCSRSSGASNFTGASPPLLNGAEMSSTIIADVASPSRGSGSRAGVSPLKTTPLVIDEDAAAVVPCLATAVVRRRPDDAQPSPVATSSATEDEALGGKLRFFLAGSCVLELRHDLDVTGRPKQWVQSWGKTYHPPAAVLPASPSLNNAPWLPKELKESPSLEDSQADKISSTQTITPSFEVVKIKKKPLSGNYMISYMRRLRRTSPLQRKVLPSCLARKVARCPQHILNGVGSNGELVCKHGTSMTGCLERRPQKKRPSSTFLEKSRNVAAIIEELTGRGGAVERPAKRPSPGASSASTSASTLASETTSSESRPQMSSAATATARDSGGAVDSGQRYRPSPVSDEPEDTKIRPLPEWYFDPNKASIPITEMIGYPRPSLQPSPGGSLQQQQQQPLNPSPKKRSLADDSDRFISGYGTATSSAAAAAAAPPTPPPSTTKRPRDRHSASPPPVPPELRFGSVAGARCEPGSSEHMSSLLQAAGLAMAAGGAGVTGGASPDASAVSKMLALLQEGAAERAAVLARIEALGCSPEAALQSLAFDEERLGADGLGCLKKKRKGGGYGRGRTIGEAVRAFVIGDILNLGGDVRTKYVPRGVFTEVASRYKIDATTTYRWWLKYCNGVRMASANAGHAESSHKSYLPTNSTVGAPGSIVNVTKTEPKKRAESVSPHERSQSVKRSSSHHRAEPNDHFRGPITDDNHHPHHNNNHHHHHHHQQTKEHGRPSHSGGSHSPRSDDSASSGASLVDPAALYASSLALFPNNGGVWPQNLPMPTLSNGQLPLNPASALPLPVGVCLPYLWNYSTLPAYVNGGLHAGQAVPSVSGIKTEAPSTSSVDEPLDLSVPKKATPNRGMTKMEIGLRRDVLSDSKLPIGQSPNFNPFMYRDCQPDELILRTLLTVQEQQAVNTASLFRIESRHVPGKKNVKGTTNANGITHRNMKPKHYPFTSLQIGTFELHSKVPNEYISEREIFKENPNKFKVIFTQRKFVYEFETNSAMDPTHDAQQKEHPHSRRMACIVVPFSIVEAFWCYGSTIILRVISKPFMFLGQRLKQVGCVPSLTVYETKKSVDLTGGQLSQSHLHKVTLLKPHLVEQLKIYLVLFDVRFRNLMAPSIFPVLRLAAEQNNPPAKEVATN